MHFPRTRPDQRSPFLGPFPKGRGRSGQAQARLDARVCPWCGVSLKGRRSDAKFCSVRCNTYHTRLERRRQAVVNRPRCCMCLKPMPYRTEWQGKGVNYGVTTCSKLCRGRRQRLRQSMMKP